MNKIIQSILAGLVMLIPVSSIALPNIKCSIEGTITDNKQQPLTGVLIEFPDLHSGAVSDINGHYLITNLPKGNRLISLKYLGFITITQQVNVTESTNLNFTMEEAVMEQHEVVVTGTSHATERRKSTTPIQSISLKAMQESGSSNIIDAVAKLPGVNQVSTGPAISKPVIRGLGYNRILTISDGTRQEGQQWGDEHGIEVDDYHVTSVEVLKGPASLVYGSDALAGVINIRSDDNLPVGKIAGKITTNYQTNNGLAALHAQLGGNTKGVNWQLYGTQKATHDYKNQADGYVYNSRFANTNYGASVGINKHWGSSRLSFSSFNQDLGISEGDRDSATGKFLKMVNDNGVESDQIVTDADGRSYQKDMPRQRIQHRKLVWSNDVYLNNGGHFGLTLGYQQNIRKEFEDVLTPDIPGLNLKLNTINYDLHYLFPVIKGIQMSAGINGMQQHNKNMGVEFLVPDYTLFDIGGYFTARKDIGKWSLAGGLRLDTRSLNVEQLNVDSNGERVNELPATGSVRFAPFDRRFTSPSGSIGLSYLWNKHLTLKANIASGYRAPNIAELAANGVHEGTIRYEYGNSNLKAENSFQGDLGAEWSTEHLYVNGALFYNYIRNYTFIQKLQNIDGNDSIPNVNNEEGYPAYNYNQTNAFLFGGELFADFHPHPLDWLHLENTISYVQGRIVDGSGDSKYLPFIPPARWIVGLKASRPKLNRIFNNAFIKVELDNNFAQNNAYTAYDTETKSPGYSLLNASVGLDIKGKKNTLCSIVFAVQNITDAAYQNHLSRLRFAPQNFVTGRTGIYNMGRNFSLMLNFPLYING